MSLKLSKIDIIAFHILQRRGIDGNDKCEIKLSRPIPFRWGRVDCIPDEGQKWTPYPFEATKKELHSNAYGTGNQAVDDFKRDFNMTARETISLMATHGLTEFTKNFEESTKYKWIGGLGKKKDPISHHDINMMKGTMSNMYFKFLNGKTYWRGNAETFKSDGYFVGDANGDPVGGTAFYTSCTKAWNDPERAFGGPCHFRPTHPGKYVSLNYVNSNPYICIIMCHIKTLDCLKQVVP